jgi:hypothetical protein
MLQQFPSRSLLATAAASLLGTLGFANQVTVSDCIPLQTTNWNDTLTIPQFDPSLGVLNSVTLRFETNIEGQVFVQNRSPNPQTLGATLSAGLTLLAPDGITTLLSTAPSTPVSIPTLSAFMGLPTDPPNFNPPTGYTSPVLSAADNDQVGIPPESGFLTLANFQGNGTITFPTAAQGASVFNGNNGNEIGQFALRAAACLVVTYDFTPPFEECVQGARDVPGSLLLFPRYDNRPNNLTLVTVTNTNCDFAQGPGQLFAGTVDVEFVYIGRYGPNNTDLPCFETNITRRLTPCDTISVVTRVDNPNAERGFLYVFAKDPQSGQAIVWNHLIGQALFIGGGALTEEPTRDALNARPFLGIGRQGSTTDDDGDGIRDLDGIEYSEAPDEILIPRFLGQDPAGDKAGGQFKSRLVLVGLSGGSQFTTLVYILSYNDNEVPTSDQYAFRCWDDPKLSDISGSFDESYLDSTTNAPLEIIGADDKESGWIRIDGQIAFTDADEIQDPAIYAVLFERFGPWVVCDLPWELCTQDNGDLFPNGLFEE